MHVKNMIILMFLFFMSCGVHQLQQVHMSSDNAGNDYLLWEQRANMILFSDNTIGIFFSPTQVIILTSDTSKLTTKSRFFVSYRTKKEIAEIMRIFKYSKRPKVVVTDSRRMTYMIFADRLNFIIMNYKFVILMMAADQTIFFTSDVESYKKLKTNQAIKFLFLIRKGTGEKIIKNLKEFAPVRVQEKDWNPLRPLRGKKDETLFDQQN